MSRTAFVTGATGFVGSHLAERLATKDWKIRALVRSRAVTEALVRSGAELVRGDLADGDALREGVSGADTVFHLAAVTHARSEAEYRRINGEGTRKLAEVVEKSELRPRRVVYLSSYAACGPSNVRRPRELSEVPAPLSAYGRSKLAGEEAVRPLQEQGIGVVILRAPAVYGPGDRALLTYFRLIRRGIAPAPAGDERRLHMIFVRDLAAALVHAADAPPGTYAVAEPVEYRWDDLIEVIARSMRKRPIRLPLPPALVRMAAAVTERVGGLAGRAMPFNREKAREMLAEAWTCDLRGSEAVLPLAQVTPLAYGVASTIQWYESQGWL